MPPHVHTMRPLWLILMAPADLEGWQRVCTYAECLICHERATLVCEQHPQEAQSRVLTEEGH